MATKKNAENVEEVVETVEVTETATAETTETTETVANTFTKAKLVGSKRFANRRDLLNALLKNDREYTIAEVETIIDNFMKGGK